MSVHISTLGHLEFIILNAAKPSFQDTNIMSLPPLPLKSQWLSIAQKKKNSFMWPPCIACSFIWGPLLSALGSQRHSSTSWATRHTLLSECASPCACSHTCTHAHTLTLSYQYFRSLGTMSVSLPDFLHLQVLKYLLTE